MIIDYELPLFESVPEIFDELLAKDVAYANEHFKEVGSQRAYVAKRHSWLRPYLRPNDGFIVVGTHVGVYPVVEGAVTNSAARDWHVDIDRGYAGAELALLSTTGTTLFAACSMELKNKALDSDIHNLRSFSTREALTSSMGLDFLFRDFGDSFGNDWLEQASGLAELTAHENGTIHDYIQVENVAITQAMPGVLARGDVNRTLHRSSIAGIDTQRVLLRSLISRPSTISIEAAS